VYRGSFAIVDERAITANVAAIKQTLHANTRLMIAVKANGYGHGATRVVEAALAGGATDFGVATVEEALQLRTADVRSPILVLGAVTPAGAAAAARHQIAVAMVDDWRLDDAYAQIAGPLQVHIKVDTGMSRLGVQPDLVCDLMRWVDRQPNLHLAGLFTHLACADASSSAHSQSQIDRFDSVLADIRANGLTVPLVHAANSGGTLRDRAWHYDMVRVGIAAYGYPPSPTMLLDVSLQPAMGLYSMITRIADLAAGSTISYGATYTAKARMRVATVPIGYADGYPRALSNKSHVAVHGMLVPVVGTVCMDQLMIDVSDVDNVQTGDAVTLFGAHAPADWHMRELVARADDEAAQVRFITDTFAANVAPARVPTLSLDTLATQAGTISYELMCALSPRVPRLYVQG